MRAGNAINWPGLRNKVDLARPKVLALWHGSRYIAKCMPGLPGLPMQGYIIVV